MYTYIQCYLDRVLFRLDGYFVRGPRVLPHPQEQVVAVLLRVLNYVDYYCHYHYVTMILLSTRRLDPRRIRQNERHGTTVLDALMKSSYDPSSDAPRHVGSFFWDPLPFSAWLKSEPSEPQTLVEYNRMSLLEPKSSIHSSNPKLAQIK